MPTFDNREHYAIPHGVNQIAQPIVLVTYNVEQNQSRWRLGRWWAQHT